MKWRDLEHALSKKCDTRESQSGSRHERIWVTVDGKVVGPVLISRGSDEMKDREIGNCARSLGLKERPFRDFVSCTQSREQFAALVVIS